MIIYIMRYKKSIKLKYKKIFIKIIDDWYKLKKYWAIVRKLQ